VVAVSPVDAYRSRRSPVLGIYASVFHRGRRHELSNMGRVYDSIENVSNDAGVILAIRLKQLRWIAEVIVPRSGFLMYNLKDLAAGGARRFSRLESQPFTRHDVHGSSTRLTYLTGS
jgi:hypothetical protein